MLIIGYFDPLHASHVRRLKEIVQPGETVVVAIDDPPDPLLPHRARAELAASLRYVKFVVSASVDLRSALPHARVVDLRPEHNEMRDSLSSHVVRRQSAE